MSVPRAIAVSSDVRCEQARNAVTSDGEKVSWPGASTCTYTNHASNARSQVHDAEMQGCVRKRHKPDCAKRADRMRRCNWNGSWQARYPDPVKGGTAKIERTFRTERDAHDWLVSQSASVLSGTHVDPRQSERPFSEVVEAWQGSWSGRLSPDGGRTLPLDARRLPLLEFGRMPVGRITHEVVQRYVDRLAADESIGTLRRSSPS
jgi:hypothetical protein